MRIILIIALVAFALWILIAGLRNKKRVSGIALIVLLVPAGVLGYFEYVWQETQTTISQSMRDISGNRNVTLDCQRMSFAFFDVWASEKTVENLDKTKVTIKYNGCKELLTWVEAENKDEISEELVKAMHLLTSETMRTSNDQLSSVEQKCLGLVNMPAMVQNLGGTEAQGTYFYRYFKQELMTKEYEMKKLNC